jgi:tetratricopeptide (TPR) repeat protein
MSKPVLTGTAHPLPFERLSPLDFERLCLWLVTHEGFERAEHLGEAGNEQGRDVVAWKDGRRFAFQCKRVQAFTASHARKEIEKLRGLPPDEQPHELVFIVSRAVSATTRRAVRDAWGDEASCHFWAGSELDALVKRHPKLLAEFFQLPPSGEPAPFRHNLPFPSLRTLFHGREQVLARLRETLLSTPAGRATAIAGKAIHGLGGVGKTRLAIEYAWQHAADYSSILFVVAGSPSDLRRNLAELCAPKILDLPEHAITEEEVREAAVLRRLGEQPGWLLILDNVDSPEAAEAVDALVAGLHGGHVLLTGRLAHWGAEVEAIELDLLTEEAAIAFLLERTAGKRRSTPEDAAQATTLARELGYLPLALEQAGAAIAIRGLTFAGYLRDWKTRRDKVLTWFDSRVSHYPVSFAVTWQTSVDRLTAPARRLLERLAWLGPEPVPESLLEVPVPGLPEAEEGLDPSDTLVELATYSLVTQASEPPTFTVHRLVQDVTRRSLRKDPGNGPLTEALAWVNAAFVGDPEDVRTWPVLAPLAPHARAVVTHADAAEIAEPTARLMSQLGQLLKAKALHAEAEPLMRRALAIDESSFGADHPYVATDLNNLAQLLKATNRLAEAEPLMRRVVAILESSLGADHPDIASAFNNLAQLLQATNRLAEAEPLMRRVVTILESSGADHPNVAAALNNLAQLLKATNRLDEAEPLMRRALAIDENSFGTDHPYVARDLNNLARLLQDTKRLDEAEPLMRRALAIDESSFGTDHPSVAIRLNNLAALLQDTNRLDEAEPMMRRHLVILLDFTRRTGHEHPHLRAAFGNFALLLHAMEKTEAEIEAEIAELVESPPRHG